MPAPGKILELIERFERNRADYRSGRYKEDQLRIEFLNPFFEALGWDVSNAAGYAEGYKDVIHEDAVKIGGATKAPDYCFRVGGARKFFVEAKKPSVDIKGEPAPAYQLRRYAWSSKLPVSILTDFEEFAVYDCRVKPSPRDKASVARALYLTCADYAAKWDELAAVFSREAVLKGSFDKFAESGRGKKGTAEVDAVFLEEIELWRAELARNLAARNPKLSVRDLNFAVGRTIDRLIFLRIAEDRGIESYGALFALVNGEHVYKRLLELFGKADARYNSGLFHFEHEDGEHEPPDELTPGLKLDDEPLQHVIRRLYYPESPYEFSVLPADILGQVYEQFLGKVIRLTKEHHAKVEDKPEVKKAGGVYYTPTYIVDYIVKNTVGKLLEGRTPKQVAGDSRRAPLRVLDPACGSGSFLIGAYQFLLDWYRDQYVKDGPEKRRKELYQAGAPSPVPGTRTDPATTSPASGPCPRGSGEWRLTTAERKRILLAHIFGVDIDPQAVEVTKLSLLLKVLEGETGETLRRQLAMFHERALPDLGANIKCGNSLIGTDFYAGRQLAMFGDEERIKINAFDWQGSDGFPETMKAGGFDAVIGNPPYIRVRIFRELYPEQAEYLESHYDCATHVWDVYLLFFERSLRLLKHGGRVAFIVPIQTLHQPNCESLRRLLLERSRIKTVADLSRLKVFQEAIVKNCILACENAPPDDSAIETIAPTTPGELHSGTPGRWSQKAALNNPQHSLKLDLLSPRKNLCDKLRATSWMLGELCYVTFGLRSCAKGKGQGGKDRLITTNAKARNAKPYMEGREIKRYAMFPARRFIRYIPEEMYSPRQSALFEQDKIVSQSMLSKMQLVATLDEKGYYVEQSLVCIIPHGTLTKDKPPAELPLKFLLGVINSRLQKFYFSTQIIDYSLGGGLIHATPGSQEKLIIPKADAAHVDLMVSLVERMLELHKRLGGAKGEAERVSLARLVAATDSEIDKLVYELYGLSKSEIELAEGAAR